MGEEREYLKQVNKNLIKVFTKKSEAVMVEWVDTEEGRDEHQSWERVVHGGLVVYINNYDRSSRVYGKEDFLNDLEAIYNLGLAKLEKSDTKQNRHLEKEIEQLLKQRDEFNQNYLQLLNTTSKYESQKDELLAFLNKVLAFEERLPFHLQVKGKELIEIMK